MEVTVAKRDLLTKKTEHDLPFAIEKSDIVALVSTAWEKSFATKITNRKAISERGWGPLNYNLLLTAEIKNTSTQLNSSLAGTTTNSNVTPEMLNLDILGH